MKRASSKLLQLHLHNFHPKSPVPLVPRDFSSAASIDEQNNHKNQNPSNPHLKSCSKTQSLLFSRNPSHNLTTLVDPQNPSSQRQRRIKEKSQLLGRFEAAKTGDEMVKAFEEMESAFDDQELGLACLKIGLKLDDEGGDMEKVLGFALRALEILDIDDENLSLPLAMNLQLLGSACYGLQRFNDSLGYLNRANRILGKLEENGVNEGFDIKHVSHAVHLNLANTKNAMGRREDALGNLQKCLEIKESSLDQNSRELGDSYRDMAEAHVALLDFRAALPYCTKAVDIHWSELGSNSVEVAHDRRLLGVIYTGLEEHEKALEQNQLSQRVLRNWGLNSDLLRAEIDAANMLIALGRFDEAVDTLKSVVSRADKESQDRAMIFVSMAKALCNQEKFPESKNCLKIATGILEKKEKVSPLEVSEAYMEISMQYETMNEFETAVSLLKRAQSMLEKIPQEQHSVGSVSARIGWLLLLTGKVKDAIPYLEEASERLKESFGPKHFGVGYVYNNLGAAYLELDRAQSAAQVFALAKDIMDVSLGPHHVDSIEACQNLSKAYAAMGSYALAVNFQEKAMEGWKGHGPSAHDELKEAERVLEQLMTKACGTPSAEAIGRNRSSRAHDDKL